MAHEFDKSGKSLIQHHGDSLLALANDRLDREGRGRIERHREPRPVPVWNPFRVRFGIVASFPEGAFVMGATALALPQITGNTTRFG